MKTISTALIAAGAIIALVALYLYFSGEVQAQAVPDHKHLWYAPQCCNGKDCEPLPDETGVIEQKGGYFIPVSGELIPYADARIRESQDGHFHRCDVGGTTRCLYVPGRGS